MFRRFSMNNTYVNGRANPARSSGISRIATIVAFMSIGAASPALAGSRFIANIIPDPDPNRTDRISGFTFDGGPNPLILDGTSWRLSRLDVETGAVQQSTIPSQHPSGTTRSLVFDSASETYFTESNQTFASIDLTVDSASIVSGGWPGFNFQSMAINPVDGRLWLATDNSGGQLWEVNKTTGAVTLHRTFGVFNGGISALAIGPTGNFYVTGGLQGFDRDSLYQIDPDTGAVDFVTSLEFSITSDFLYDFDYSPTTGRWYGMKELRSTNPREHHFIEITDIPEPASAGVFICTGALSLMQRRRRRR